MKSDKEVEEIDELISQNHEKKNFISKIKEESIKEM